MEDPGGGDKSKPSERVFSSSKEHRLRDFYRLTVFISMESLFAALTWVCRGTPLQLTFKLSLLDSPFASPVVKSAFTNLFMLWHTVAIAFAGGIWANTFSREWAAKRERTDKVSTITATIWKQFRYSCTSRATCTYRTAYVAMIALLLMGVTAPATITISSNREVKGEIPLSIIPHLTPVTLPTSTSDNIYDQLLKAQSIVELEKIDRVLIGYAAADNWFVPLPYGGQIDAARIQYMTDVVNFVYWCQWKEPEGFDADRGAFIVDGGVWSPLAMMNMTSETVARKAMMNVTIGSTILQLVSHDPIHNNGTSAYLFLGDDSAHPTVTKDPNLSYIDLTGLPYRRDQGRYAVQGLLSPRRWFVAPLASILLCDPRMQFTAGKVTIEPVANITESDITVEAVGEMGSVGVNILPDSARIIFAEALLAATSFPNGGLVPSTTENSTINFNTIAANMFLTPPASDRWQSSSAIRPLSLDDINQSMDEYMLSGLKAFTSGFHPANSLKVGKVPATVFSRNVSASRAGDGLSFVADTKYAVLHLFLTVVAAVLLTILAGLNVHYQGRKPFDLENITNDTS